MKQSTHRILTTHCGSLARPTELLDVMKAKVNGEPYDSDKYTTTLRHSVADIVSKQAECGIDIVADGEQSKPGFFTYVRERLTGFEKKDARQRRRGRNGQAKSRCFRNTMNSISAGA